MGRTSASLITIPVLPGLDDLPRVVSGAIWVVMSDPEYRNLPEGYTKYDLQFDLSDPRNWYTPGGHHTPSHDECVRYAKDYIRAAREKVQKDKE